MNSLLIYVYLTAKIDKNNESAYIFTKKMSF